MKEQNQLKKTAVLSDNEEAAKLLQSIKESAEEVEIPEALQPKRIEALLTEKAKESEIAGGKPKAFRIFQKKHFLEAKHFLAASVVLVFMLGLIPLGINLEKGADQTFQNPNDGIGKEEISAGTSAEKEPDTEVVRKKKQNAGELYIVAQSEDEVLEYLKRRKAEGYSHTDYAVIDGAIAEEAAEDVGFESGNADSILDMAKQEGIESEGEEQEYSTTNLQMQGVDESDIVKTNGTHIFVVKNNMVWIAKVENGSMKKLGKIVPERNSFSDKVLEMYVDGDRLVLIVQQIGEALSEETIVRDGTIEICYEDLAYRYDTKCQTVLYTYDISNPAKPTELGRMEQDGTYKTSRKIEDMIYLFTENTICLNGVTETEFVDALPKVAGEEISYDSMYLSKNGEISLTVSSVSLAHPDRVVDKTLIFNDYVKIYISSDAMYLYEEKWKANEYITEIAKFTLDAGQISAVGAANVLGEVRDTFAINEYKGNLRVLTTKLDNNSGERSNQLYLFDEAFKPAGCLEEIAPGEVIYAARYFGDLAYFVTYRNMDPLFAADLSDIQHPKLLGELEISGYSEYLHPWGEDKLLGIGYETDAKTGRQIGIKLVMFDISNPAELSILDTVVLKEEDESAALSNYKCVLADAKANLIGFSTIRYERSGNEEQMRYWVYSFADGKFEKQLVSELGEIQKEAEIRGLYIGDYFYLVKGDWIRSFNRTEAYKAVSELEF